MPRLFVRKSKSVGNWDLINDQTPEDLSFPADILADVLDAGNEVSVWELDPDSPEMAYLIAALHRPTDENLAEATFRVVSAFRLEELGLKIKTAGGNSLDNKLNGCHRAIEIVTVSDAMKLAKAFKLRSPYVFSKAEVMRRFAASLQAKRIKTDKVSHQLWNKLIDGGFMQVVETSAASSKPTSEAAASVPASANAGEKPQG